jgi:hypothetical protein
MKLYGTVTDFGGRPLEGAEVRVDGRDFRAYVTYALTDEHGRYELDLAPGTYLDVWICRDYKEKMLEYWAWHVPMEGDRELNARVHRLEVYGLNAFWPRQRATLMVFFRPMSLTRALAWQSGNPNQPGAIDIVPRLGAEDIEITIDGRPAPLLCVNKVREEAPPNNYMDAYLVHVQADGIYATDAYRKIDVTIVDRETDERGEGTVFWRHTLYEG